MKEKITTIKLADVLLADRPEKHQVIFALNKAVVDASDELYVKYGYDGIELSKKLSQLLKLDIVNRQVTLSLSIKLSIDYEILLATVIVANIFIKDLDVLYKVKELYIIDNVAGVLEKIITHNKKYGNKIVLVVNTAEKSSETEQLLKDTELSKTSSVWGIEKHIPRKNNQKIKGEIMDKNLYDIVEEKIVNNKMNIELAMEYLDYRKDKDSKIARLIEVFDVYCYLYVAKYLIDNNLYKKIIVKKPAAEIFGDNYKKQDLPDIVAVEVKYDYDMLINDLKPYNHIDTSSYCLPYVISVTEILNKLKEFSKNNGIYASYILDGFKHYLRIELETIRSYIINKLKELEQL